MAFFEVKVYPITLEPHPNADAIELAVIGDYRSIVRIGQFQNGDKVAYIPEGSIVPDDLLEAMDLTGKLAGSKGNRVKAVRLRGVLSQGLCYPAPDAELGEDLAEGLGIVKYEPVIPSSMAGEVWNALGMTLRFDIENIKKFPDAFLNGAEVVITEKLHGTFCQMGVYEGQPLVSSKGAGGRGLAFKDNEANNRNVYLLMYRRYLPELEALHKRVGASVYVLGEIYGKGIQDLTYDLPNKQFRVFDVYVGNPSHGRYLDYGEIQALLADTAFELVPLLYQGPYNKDMMESFTIGDSVIASHIREGVVVKPVHESIDMLMGRVLVKSISPDYLLRHGSVTEFE